MYNKVFRQKAESYATTLSSLRAAIVAINHTPVTEATLLLRILGKGHTQKQAIDEVIAFDARDSRRSAI
jgi:hypothetical protein